MRWSWVEYCSLPVDYFDVLVEVLKKEDAELKRAAQRRR
jgi:hypothetical protein